MEAKFRIGLSATPWNPGQDEQKTVLEKLYGPVVSTYSLGDALRDGVLCPYMYECVPCDFDEDEAEEYERLSSQIGILMAQDPHRQNQSLQIQIQNLSSKRTRLLGSLRDKLNKLDDILADVNHHPHTLIYCGEGQHPLDIGTLNQERSIEQVTQYLANNGWKVGKITSIETMSQRERILRSFDEGFIEAVVAMRVLDEGFDIPSCRTALILASSNSYRQYVQRRGRVLRNSPGKTTAHIYDFVALPSSSKISSNSAVWRRQVEAELARVRDFINLASNSADQQFRMNAEMETRGLGAIYYSNPTIDEDELDGY